MGEVLIAPDLADGETEVQQDWVPCLGHIAGKQKNLEL